MGFVAKTQFLCSILQSHLEKSGINSYPSRPIPPYPVPIPYLSRHIPYLSRSIPYLSRPILRRNWIHPHNWLYFKNSLKVRHLTRFFRRISSPCFSYGRVLHLSSLNFKVPTNVNLVLSFNKPLIHHILIKLNL